MVCVLAWEDVIGREGGGGGGGKREGGDYAAKKDWVVGDSELQRERVECRMGLLGQEGGGWGQMGAWLITSGCW